MIPQHLMELFAEYLITGHLPILTKSFILDISRDLDPPLHEPYGPLFCICNSIISI